MIAAGRTDRGREREANEDSFYISTTSPLKVFAVADGMGGHAAGEVASALVIGVVRRYAERMNSAAGALTPQQLPALITTLMHEANKLLLEEGARDPFLKGMGTTLTMAVVMDTLLTIGHIGDSRAYLIDAEKYELLTEDHSLVIELVKSGEIAAEEARTHPQRHLLTRALGMDTLPDPDICQRQISTDQYLLLCTDGLTSLVNEEELYQVVLDRGTVPRQAVDDLIRLANHRGGYDNITVTLVTGAGGNQKS